eukprot:Platyproteum_vivax@DN8249_c0_g1_i1.p1
MEKRPWTERQFQKILQPTIKLLPEEIELLKEAGLWTGHKKKAQPVIEPRVARTRGNKRDYAALVRGADGAVGLLDTPKATRSANRSSPKKGSSENSENTSTSNAFDEEYSVEDERRQKKTARQRPAAVSTR